MHRQSAHERNVLEAKTQSFKGRMKVTQAATQMHFGPEKRGIDVALTGAEPCAGFSLTHHARFRLKERCLISEDEVLALLNQGAAVSIGSDSRMAHRRIDDETPSVGPAQFESWTATYRRQAFWSEKDLGLLIAISAKASDTVVTILNSRHVVSEGLRRQLTDGLIARCAAKVESIKSGKTCWSELEVLVAWVDDSGMPKRQKRTASKVPHLDAFDRSLAERLEAYARPLTNGSQNAWVVLRSRRNPADIALEVSLN